jgi:hypothetical protein
LFAPAPGGETRRKLADTAHSAASRSERKVQEKIAEAAQRAEAKAGDIGRRVGREAAEAAVRAVSKEVLGEQGKKSA